MTAVELVGAAGEPRRVDAASDPELFWALRGGNAGSFGAVTALEFDLLPIAEVYGGALMYRQERAAAVLHAWRDWTDGLPEEMSISRTRRSTRSCRWSAPARARS